MLDKVMDVVENVSDRSKGLIGIATVFTVAAVASKYFDGKKAVEEHKDSEPIEVVDPTECMND